MLARTILRKVFMETCFFRIKFPVETLPRHEILPYHLIHHSPFLGPDQQRGGSPKHL